MQSQTFQEPPPERIRRVVYVGFASRFIGYIIDWLFLMLTSMVVGLSIGIIANLENLEILNVVSLALSLISPFFYIAFWAFAGATPGKILLGMRIVGPDGGTNGIGILRAILRLIGYMVSSLFFYLGFIWIILDNENRAWHDIIAGTHVVQV